MESTIELSVAFIAGLVSFITPCVVVLIPAFLSHIAGVGLLEIEKTREARRSVLLNTVAFIAGFTVVFVLAGTALGYFSEILIYYQIWIERVGGALIILFGLVVLGIIKIPFLQKGIGIKVSDNREGRGKFFKILSAVVIGAVFAIGWTPCVGPVLAAIFVLAAASGSAASGALLLLFYSSGIMLPFLLVGLFTTWMSKFIMKSRRVFSAINIIAGVVLIALGIVVLTGNFAKVVGYFYFLQ